ncbi:MAG: lactate utilization protein [Bacteroidales bacterium]|nr:lactate utilization protein [Bacteroidales bacterium]MBR5028719.1 lactate utilization protein [Bacteroidales bacterium]
MKGSYYDNFLSETRAAAENKSWQKQENPVVDTEFYSDYNIAKQRLSHSLQTSVEEMDKLLVSFDNKWEPSNGKKYWFTNYDDLLRGLRTLIWEKNVKTFHTDDIDSYLWTEIGLNSFLKKEKVKANSDCPNIQFFEVNKIIAESNTFLILGNENTIKMLNNNAINVFVTGIEQIMKNADDLELYLKVLKDSNIKNDKNLFPILYTPTSKNTDNLFILDNMRSNVVKFVPQRSALACIHCGRCSQVCPVFQCAGHKAYDNIFSGPIANILLPHLETIDDYKFVSYACIMCGNCEKVCPISLPLRKMIIENRRFFYEKGHLSYSEKSNFKKIGKAISNRKKLNKIKIVKTIKFRSLMSKDFRKHRKFPPFEKYSFNQQYIKNLKEKFK